MKISAKKNELIELRKLLSEEYQGQNPHLDSDLGAMRYINNADKIKSCICSGNILDWGCGLGHMTYLLKRRELKVVSFDIDQAGRDFLNRIGSSMVLATDPIKLPFADSSFDAVLSSGVLEHVLDPAASLKELNRVLKKGGIFFIFRLPNKFSYIEFISDRLGRGDHPVKYTCHQIEQALKEAGFETRSIKYQSLLPYNLKGFPAMVRKLYHKLDFLWQFIDPVLSACPGLNFFCTNIELIAGKK